MVEGGRGEAEGKDIDEEVEAEVMGGGGGGWRKVKGREEESWVGESEERSPGTRVEREGFCELKRKRNQFRFSTWLEW